MAYFRPKNKRQDGFIANRTRKEEILALGPYRYFDFRNDAEYVGGTTLKGLMSFSRSTDAYYHDSNGLLTMVTAHYPRIGNRGFYCSGQGTNEVRYSEELSNAAWANTGFTVTQDGTLSPDKTKQAWRLEANAISSAFRQTFTTTNTSYDFSIFFKVGNSTSIVFRVRNGTTSTNTVTAFYDVATNTCDVPEARIENYIDGWKRIIISVSAGFTVGDICTFYAMGIGSASYPAVGEYNYFWGAQYSPYNSYAWHYIPTTSTSAITASDYCVNYDTSWYASGTGLAASGVWNGVYQFGGALFSLGDATANNLFYLYRNATDSAQKSALTIAGVTEGYLISNPIGDAFSLASTAASFQTNNEIASLFGEQVGVGDGTLSMLGTGVPTRWHIGRNQTGTYSYGFIEEMVLFGRSLSYSELHKITSTRKN